MSNDNTNTKESTNNYSAPSELSLLKQQSTDAKRQKTGESKENIHPTHTAPAPTPTFDSKSKADQLGDYYRFLFPAHSMIKWLAYNQDSDYLMRREFSFWREDVMRRYQCFKDGQGFHQGMCSRRPDRVEIGPIYSKDLNKRSLYNKEQYKAVERELIFDIDLSDYYGIDSHMQPKDGSVTLQTWPLMVAVVKIMDVALREDFGFNHILWVFSGRRGIHAWVCDERARLMRDEVRSAVTSYFTLRNKNYQYEHEGVTHEINKIELNNHIAPGVQRSIDILRPLWIESILPTQRYLERVDTLQWVTRLIPDVPELQKLVTSWLRQAYDTSDAMQTDSDVKQEEGDSLSVDRWQELERVAADASRRYQDKQRARAIRTCCDELMLTFAYPRLDENVSTKLNHLLKAPFCVHPKTGKVSVPVSADEVEYFNPETVPSLSALMRDLDAVGPANVIGGKAGDVSSKTRLRPCIDLFKSFIQGCQKEAENKGGANKKQGAGGVQVLNLNETW